MPLTILKRFLLLVLLINISACAEEIDEPTDTNFIPEANNDSISTIKNTTIDIYITENDLNLEDLPLTASISSAPNNGSIIVQSSDFVSYTPDDNFIGTDSFSYTISDIDNESSTATVNITVSAGQGTSIPSASDDSASTTTNNPVRINVTDNDSGLADKPITTTILSAPNNGSVIVESSDVVLYTPNSTYIGTDTFTYRVRDSNGETSSASVTITISQPPTENAIPIAVDDNSTTIENTAVDINVTTNDTNLTDTPITTTIFSSPSNGSVAIQSSKVIRYTPNTGFFGTDTFVYQIRDSNEDITTATVSVNVTCTSCAENTTLELSWNKNPDSVSGYKIYYAISTIASDATILASTVELNTSGFDPNAPSISYDAWMDFQLNKGDSICFRVKAYNSFGDSGFSSGVCKQIPL